MTVTEDRITGDVPAPAARGRLTAVLLTVIAVAVAAVAEKEGLHPEADQCRAEAARIGEQIIAEAQAGNLCLGASSRPSCVNSRSG